MKKFMIGTFLLLGFAFYEASGGADFAPEERVVAQASHEVVEDTAVLDVAAAPVIETEQPVEEVQVARAETVALLDLNTAALTQPNQVVADANTDVDNTVELLLAAVETDIVEPVVEEFVTPEKDLRVVAGSRVNVRTGPGTNFGVIDTVSGGTEAEVLEVADGWARIRLSEGGKIGWMAERLLSDG